MKILEIEASLPPTPSSSLPKLNYSDSDSETDDSATEDTLKIWRTRNGSDSSGNDVDTPRDGGNTTSHQKPNKNGVTYDSTKTTNLSLSIKGLYTKRAKYRATELPWDYKPNDLAKDQWMCRKRLKTKPLHGEPQNDNQKYDVAMFVPRTGLLHGHFWHTDQCKEQGGMPDRDILFQSMDHYKHLMRHPSFETYFDDIDLDQYPSFGEQVIVERNDSDCNGASGSADGFDTVKEQWESNQLCIGDVFVVEHHKSPLVLQVSSPRKPCYAVNKRHGTPMGLAKGMKNYTLQNGLAGWFTRVLVAGELREGMKLIRVENPHPKWTLEYISRVLYVEGMKSRSRDLALGHPTWNVNRDGGLHELKELVELEPLAAYEWKDDLKLLLDKLVKEEQEKGVHVAGEPITAKCTKMAMNAVDVAKCLSPSSLVLVWSVFWVVLAMMLMCDASVMW